MTLVNKTAENIYEGISNMMAGAKEDYISMSTGYGKKFIKLVQDRSVFAFIVKEDTDKFKKGDILKPAGYRAPAKNSARGNILSGNYYIQWTGPLYMDSQRRLRA